MVSFCGTQMPEIGSGDDKELNFVIVHVKYYFWCHLWCHR